MMIWIERILWGAAVILLGWGSVMQSARLTNLEAQVAATAGESVARDIELLDTDVVVLSTLILLSADMKKLQNKSPDKPKDPNKLDPFKKPAETDTY